jgi:hypothetical protein
VPACVAPASFALIVKTDSARSVDHPDREDRHQNIEISIELPGYQVIHKRDRNLIRFLFPKFARPIPISQHLPKL